MNDSALRLASDRYLEIMRSSRIPILGLFAESIREDELLLLPRALRRTFRTALRIPRSLFMSAGAERDRYVYDTLTRWARKICRLCHVRLEVSGEARLDPGRTYLFVANHQSPADILALYAALPVRAAFVSSSVMSGIPVFSYWMRKSGAVFVEQGDRGGEMAALKSMVRRLKGGRSLILFPEGFMNQGEELAEFNRGGIFAAVLARVPIVPVFIGGTSEVMRTGTLRIAPRRRVAVEFGEPMDVSVLGRAARDALAESLRDRITRMKDTARGAERPGLTPAAARPDSYPRGSILRDSCGDNPGGSPRQDRREPRARSAWRSACDTCRSR